jgi:hypothetical protein
LSNLRLIAALSKVWKAALVQFDEKAYFTELYDKYILSQDESVLLDFKNRIHFILPNKEDFEFALLSAVMNHPAKKGTSNSTWLSVESYKMQRSEAENWIERTKFAIDSFYERVHYIRGQYKVATSNYGELANACQATFKVDYDFKVEFATLMFGSVIGLASSALSINNVISESVIGDLVGKGTDGLVDKAAKWVAGQENLQIADAEFIFGGIGGEATFDSLTKAIASIKKTLLWSVDVSNMGIRNTLEFEIHGIENSIAALNYDKADYKTFIDELSKKVEEFIGKIEALQFDGLALKFEKLMVANWLKDSNVLKSDNGEHVHGGWDFTLPRTKEFRKKMESFEVIESGAFDGGNNSWSLIWGMFAKGVYKDAYKEDWARFDKAFNAMQKWSAETADLKRCNLFR